MNLMSSGRYWLIASGLALLITGCRLGTMPVVKIGLIAPFEGEMSHVGYQRLYGVKLALQEVNRQGGVAGYKLELVALNDNGEVASATQQVEELIIDPDVKAVVGQWDPRFFDQAWPAYQAANLPVIAPTNYSDFFDISTQFQQDFEALSHTPPTDEARQAYLATRALIDLFARTIGVAAEPTRANMWRTFSNMPEFQVDGGH